jgi:hypothetical protein
MGFGLCWVDGRSTAYWSEFAQGFCTEVLGRTPNFQACGNRVTTNDMSTKKKMFMVDGNFQLLFNCLSIPKIIRHKITIGQKDVSDIMHRLD